MYLPLEIAHLRTNLIFVLFVENSLTVIRSQGQINIPIKALRKMTNYRFVTVITDILTVPV